MNELTKKQWLKSMSTGVGDKDHPINQDIENVGQLKVENAEMAMSDVTKIIKYSEALQKMFNPSEDLEDWVEAKLNHACDYVATVRDYLKFYRDEKEAGTPEDQINEKWSRKYKQGIDCSHPKGFSQRAHCAGRRARQAGKRTKSSSVSEVELYNDVLKDLVEALIEDIGNSYMAMGALKQLNNDAKELQTMLKPETKLEDWVKAKLNLAGEYLDDVYHHLDHFGPEGRKLDEGDDFYDPERRRTQAMGFRSTVDNPKPKDMETEDRASYWISPDGEIINANKNHKKWVLDNRLKRNIQMVDDSPMKSAFMKGYIKISRLPNGIVVDSVPDQYDMGGGFYKNGHEGIYPKISEKALDAIQKFIDDRQDIALVIDSDRKRLKDFRVALPENLTEEQMDEIWKNWKQALATTALATSMLGAPDVNAAPAKSKKPVSTAVKKTSKPTSVKKASSPTPEKKIGGKVFVNPSEIPTSNAMEAYILRNEGAVRNLYYIGGKPHIGVGHHLDGSSNSKQNINAIILSDEEIVQVKDPEKQEKLRDTNQKLKKYVGGSSVKNSIDDKVMLTNEQIAKLFSIDFRDKKDIAKSRHPKFNTFPALVQTMIIDSIFRGEKHPETDKLINSENPNWTEVAKKYLDDAEFKQGGGVALRMQRNADLLTRAAEDKKQVAVNRVKEQHNI